MAALLWECLISSVYWSILYSYDKERVAGSPSKKFWNYAAHLFPIVFLTIEWLLNRIFFEMNQIWGNLAIILIYGLLNIAVTFSTG
mmetsp:Transcript_11730/g.15932  ORF Transcript_11730/g.15932 Transcript_11730/m.15932 type:complete len:86 (+) Transcript_11730:445-702(+)